MMPGPISYVPSPGLISLHLQINIVNSNCKLPEENTSGYLIVRVGCFLYASGTRIIKASSGVRPLLINS